MFPWSLFLKERRKRLSDIEYLAIKEFDGKLTTGEGTLTVTGDLVTITAAVGKDMYLAKAKVSVRLETISGVTSNKQVIIELKANGVIKGTWAAVLHTDIDDVGGDSNATYEFAIAGIKVAATEIIKLEVVTLGTLIEANGELVVFEEDTGATPAV